MEAYEKEFELYPEAKKANLNNYLRLYVAEKKADANAVTQKEIENILKDGLKEENDYNILEGLYGIAKLPQQAKLIIGLKKEKFPNGKWVINEAVNKFYAERDPAKKEILFAEIATNISIKPEWNYMEPSLPGFEQAFISSYLAKKDWVGIKKALDNSKTTDKSQLASLYNNIAWQMQLDSSADLTYAEKLSKMSIDIADANRKAPDA